MICNVRAKDMWVLGRGILMTLMQLRNYGIRLCLSNTESLASMFWSYSHIVTCYNIQPNPGNSALYARAARHEAGSHSFV